MSSAVRNSPEVSWRDHLERCVREACRQEVTARKPGNVHPEAAFSDMVWTDFVRSGEAVAPALARAHETGMAAAVLEAVTRTRKAVGRNTNLGIVLLIAPLAAVPRGTSLEMGIGQVLSGLTRDDAAVVYEAIRRAQPGGMGEAAEGDVAGEPVGTLLEMMQLAAGRDQVAAQYAEGFPAVLGFGLPYLAQCDDWPERWEEHIIGLHLQLMARRPDTLIARKRGIDEAKESAARAAAVLQAGWPFTKESQRRLSEFDAWLRTEGNGRNPGTTADLVTACLFAALREGVVDPSTKSPAR